MLYLIRIVIALVQYDRINKNNSKKMSSRIIARRILPADYFLRISEMLKSSGFCTFSPMLLMSTYYLYV